MAKSFKFCQDCQYTHAVGECGGEVPQDRRKDRRKRDKVQQAEYQLQFLDPLAFDP